MEGVVKGHVLFPRHQCLTDSQLYQSSEKSQCLLLRRPIFRYGNTTVTVCRVSGSRKARLRACTHGLEPLVLELRSEGHGRAVLFVPQHGVAAGGGLDADLMRAAGFQLDFQPGSPVESFQDAVVQGGMAALGMAGPTTSALDSPATLYRKSSQRPVSTATRPSTQAQ